MDEKYLSGIGAGLILASFAIIVSFFIVTGVETKAAEENQTITFQQLSELKDNTPSKLKNNTVVQEFRNFVGETVEELKDRVILENTTLHSKLKNFTSINGTQ
jgi:type III secretory pathway component EscR